MGLMEKGDNLTGKKDEPIKENIETNLDALYYLVKKNKKVNLASAAKQLKIDQNKAEQWAKLLDKKGLISLHYPTIGETELILPNNQKSTKKAVNKTTKLMIFAVFSMIIVSLIMYILINILNK